MNPSFFSVVSRGNTIHFSLVCNSLVKTDKNQIMMLAVPYLSPQGTPGNHATKTLFPTGIILEVSNAFSTKDVIANKAGPNSNVP